MPPKSRPGAAPGAPGAALGRPSTDVAPAIPAIPAIDPHALARLTEAAARVLAAAVKAQRAQRERPPLADTG